MAQPGTLFIRNASNTVLALSVTNTSCCDAPSIGVVTKILMPSPYWEQELQYCRTDGHGCNGKQGYFTLQFSSEAGELTVGFNFDSHGVLSAGGVGTWNPTVPGAVANKLASFQSGNTMFIWNVRSYYPLPDLFTNPRGPQGSEGDGIERLLPSQDPKTCTVWGSSAQSTFNCYSWAVGRTNEILPQPFKTPSLAEVTSALMARGIYQADAEFTSNIMVWGTDQAVLHLSAFVGFPDGTLSWSSKLGFRSDPSNPAAGLLITHVMNAPDGFKSQYGGLLAIFCDPNGIPAELCQAVMLG